MANLILGCGYLGRHVARNWLLAGRTVHALTRSVASSLPTAVIPICGDITVSSTLSGLHAHHWDTILYAVGMDRSSGKSFTEVYLDGLRNVLDALPPHGRFIYISSTSVYGLTDGSWVDENSPTEPIEDNGKIILEAEQLLLRMLPDAIILRFAGIYGEGRLLRKGTLLKGEPLVGQADKWLNLIEVTDGASAISHAEIAGRPGQIYLISDGSPVIRRDFYTFLAERLGAPPARFEPLPADAPIPRHELGNRRINSAKARADLHWSPIWPDYIAGLISCTAPAIRTGA